MPPATRRVAAKSSARCFPSTPGRRSRTVQPSRPVAVTREGAADQRTKMEEKESREESARMAKIAKTKAQVEESNKYYNENAKPGSLAAKANMVAKYNEKHEKGNKK